MPVSSNQLVLLKHKQDSVLTARQNIQNSNLRKKEKRGKRSAHFVFKIILL